MANDKKFVVKNGLQTPNINFADTKSNTAISATMLSSDVLSFSGNTGQLFSISDSMTGTIFAVNDISGIPSIEVLDTGIVRIAQYSGNILVGAATDNGIAKLQVQGITSSTSGYYVGAQQVINSSAQWVGSNYNLQGIQGRQGIQGTTGSQGTTGAQGIQGVTGSQGTIGSQGTTGAQGIQGTTGSQGTTGAQGIQGTTGSQGTTGAQGIQGTTGSQGTTGAQGTSGFQGIQGTQGTIGFQGIQGTQGTIGLQGTTGAQGIQGTVGSQGTTGTQGIQGLTGSQGTTGAQGIQGLTGPQGIQGVTGSQGLTGVQGIQGTQGIQGVTGSQGLTGVQGIQGTQGIQGLSGPSNIINATDDNTDTSLFPVMVTAAGSNQTANVSTAKLYFNAVTGDLSATNFNSLSDIQFKTNFNSNIDSFSILDKIQTYEFEWKDNGDKSYGVIAQEIEKMMPELVKTNEYGVKTVSYIPLIAILIDAVKKLAKDR